MPTFATVRPRQLLHFSPGGLAARESRRVPMVGTFETEPLRRVVCSSVGSTMNARIGSFCSINGR